MAKIVEELFVIKFSKIAKDSDTDDINVGTDVSHAIEQVAQELVGSNIIVEVMKA